MPAALACGGGSLAKEGAFKEGLSHVRSEQAVYDHRLQNKEYDQLLFEAIQQLPPQQKEVYNLSREQGLKNEEIANRLNLSINTVKKHLVLALHSIRAHVLSRLRNFLFVLAIILWQL